ncbi:NAD-dependent dihydropyrimidine dehydrogenase PreA subunit [Desulfitispora alkaliphila]|uniref:indolepyruvate ferredoxin oxidoreductase subunit alpha n=1 Tax=Desulfitispora alkaliphila TaxID=622674 RepID=UPI003D1B3004
MYLISIDEEKCTGCGECVDVCPVSHLEMKDEVAVTNEQTECVGCDSCVETCPVEAITLTEY